MVIIKYIECGIGNTWFVRTEFEDAAGNEYEVQGISGPILPIGVYLRLWIGYSVFIISTNQGIKWQKKERKAFKLILGIQSKLL